jgi:hypothetical protein
VLGLHTMNSRTLVVSGVLVVAASVSLRAECPYPNELPGLKKCASSRWKSLVPLDSTMEDVRSALGEPTFADDIGPIDDAPYPGDEKAEHPLFTYSADSGWTLHVYFVKTSTMARRRFPQFLYDRVLAVDLVPPIDARIPVEELLPPFKKEHVEAMDADRDEFADGTGLRYEVSTASTPSGDQRQRYLKRIVYGASDATVAKYAIERP